MKLIPSRARKVKGYVKFLSNVRTWRRGEADPRGCLLAGAQAMEATVLAFVLRRTGELKHGWISMLAIMGYITADITGKFPGCLSPSMDLKFTDIPNGLSAVSKIPALGWI